MLLNLALGAAVPAAAAFPSAEVRSIVAAAASSVPVNSTTRCLNAKLPSFPADTSSLTAGLSNEGNPTLLAEASRAVDGKGSSSAEIDQPTSRIFRSLGWRIVSESDLRQRSGCGVFVTVANPHIGVSYAYTSVTYSIHGSGRIYIYPVLLRHFDDGWRLLVIGQGKLLVF